MFPTRVTIELPDWLKDQADEIFASPRQTSKEMMALAIRLSAKNIEHGGGPFGAAVFEADTGEVVSIGTNVVVKQGLSLGHAEMVALSFAQARVGSFTLAQPGGKRYVLATSAQMCAMCLGNTVWSGVHKVVIGATAGDTERLTGFDEGPIRGDWESQLIARGIEVETDVLRHEACQVLARYKADGGIIYNGGAAESSGMLM